MRLTIKESQLHKMIAESVKKVLKEAYPKIPQWNW